MNNNRWYLVAGVIFLVLAIINLVQKQWLEGGLWALVAGGLALSPLSARPRWRQPIMIVQVAVLIVAIVLLAGRVWLNWGI